MELQSISAVSGALGMTPRMLRYYEKVGLVESRRREGYAYRVYDEANLRRLRQIQLLRRLRLSTRQIGLIFSRPEAATAVEVFSQNLRQLEGEVAALEAIRGVLAYLVARLRQATGLPLRLEELCDEELLALVPEAPANNLLSRPPPSGPAADNTMLEETLMKDLDMAEMNAPVLRDVRIVWLPPATVAASHFVGPEPENVTGDAIEKFVREANLAALKPDLRVYGFNHPNPVDETDAHGYEFWVTIPDELAVPAPLVKKHFPGGMYAAHAIAMGNFQEWALLDRWVQQSETYDYNGSGTPENMFGALEEHLNYYGYVTDSRIRGDEMQLDLMIPVKRRGGTQG